MGMDLITVPARETEHQYYNCKICETPLAHMTTMKKRCKDKNYFCFTKTLNTHAMGNVIYCNTCNQCIGKMKNTCNYLTKDRLL